MISNPQNPLNKNCIIMHRITPLLPVGRGVIFLQVKITNSRKKYKSMPPTISPNPPNPTAGFTLFRKK
jgi:hypothetical protein